MKVIPKVGQVWNTGKHGNITLPDPMTSWKGKEYFEVDELKSIYAGNFIQDNWQFVPQNDLEWLAVNVSELRLSAYHIYKVKGGDDYEMSTSHVVGGVLGLKIIEKRNELFGTETITASGNRIAGDKQTATNNRDKVYPDANELVKVDLEKMARSIGAKLEEAEVNMNSPVDNSVTKMKFEHVKCDDSIFDLRDDFEAGNLYFMWHGKDVGYDQIVDIRTLTARYDGGNIYCKVETPVTWQEEVKSLYRKDFHPVSIGYMVELITSDDGWSKEALKFCHRVASLTDKPD